VSDETIDDLLQVTAEFGNCGDCVYVQSGYPLPCTTCAARTLEPLAPKDARCPVCDRPYTTGDGTCLNGPCNMGDLNRGFAWNWSISMRTGVLKDRIDDYKFHGKTGWGLIFGRILVGSAVIDKVEGGTAYIVTKRGRPAAVLLPIEDAEDAVLANADEYVRLRREAREEQRIGHTVSLGDIA